MEKTVGRKADILFLNEAVLLPEQAFTTLMQGIRKFAILNFNPTKHSYIEKFVKPDGKNLLKTTFKDNNYLTFQQIEEFEDIKRRALSPTATILDLYNYQVFYCGNYNNTGGQVFKFLYRCTDQEYKKIPSKESLGLDFGFKDGADETVLIGIKIYNNCLYVKEYLNSNSLANNEKLAKAIADCGILYTDTIFADWGGMGKERIRDLVSAGDYKWTDPKINKGFNVVNAIKGRVIDGISKMLQFDKIIITDSSEKTRTEFERYELNEEGAEISKHQNAVDAARYATMGYYRL